MRLAIVLAVIGGSLAVLCWSSGLGCQSSTKWKAGTASTLPAGPEPDRLLGLWTGTWTSTDNDMTGPLRCEVVKLPDGKYRARFDATFAKVLTHTSIVDLNVNKTPQAWECFGEKDLGLLLGLHKYKGKTDGASFECSYDSSMDKGNFKLRRPAAQ